MENQFLDSNFDNETPEYFAYAGFWRRFAAVFIDGLILAIVSMIVYSVFGVSLFRPNPEMFENGIPVSYSIAYLINVGIQISYFAYLESSEKQGTFGKQAMGIVVTGLNGERITMLNAVGRYFARILSALIMGIGYLIQPFTAKKQALHDMIAGTLVYKR